jgi:hypothetical protein
MEIKVGLLASGEILLDGRPVDLVQLGSRLLEANASQDQVVYYKEDAGQDRSVQSMEIIKLVMKHKLAISLSTNGDLADYVDRFSQTQPRATTPAPPARERPAPFVPDVDLRRNVEELFAEARSAAAKSLDERGITFIGPNGSVIVLPAPQRSPEIDAQLPIVPDISSDRPLNIAVIANTGFVTTVQGVPLEVEAVAKAIPFLGTLISFCYASHRVWIFEGHSSTLAAGLQNAEILLVDSAMLPMLPSDWMSVAQSRMDPPRRVLIYSRERTALLPAVPASTPEGWSYSEPDGEASYVNCLLTTLAKSGAGASAELVTDAPLPNLAGLTQNADELEWIASLPFQYDQLDACKAIELLARSRTPSQNSNNEWHLKTLLVAAGKRRPCQFSLRLSANEAKQVLSIRVV